MLTALRDVRSQEQSGKHLLTVGSSQLDPRRTLPLRQSGHAHALVDALTFGEVNGIVAR